MNGKKKKKLMNGKKTDMLSLELGTRLILSVNQVGGR